MRSEANQLPDPGAETDSLLLRRSQDELAASFEQLRDLGRAVCVLGSARTTAEEPDYELARVVARRLGDEGFSIITGGGPGIMEAANRGASEAGALSVGLVTELPADWVNPYLDRQLRFTYFFTRKVAFVRYASAFVIFPGGFGTLDELFELAALVQTGRVAAQPIVLVGGGYWDPLVCWLKDTVLHAGNITPADLGLLAVADGDQETVERVLSGAGRI